MPGRSQNHVIVLPDADMTSARRSSATALLDVLASVASRFLSRSPSAKRKRLFVTPSLSRQSLKVGNGLEDGVQMGPVITPQSKSRVESLIANGEKEGAKFLIDGRNPKIPRRIRKFREAYYSRWVPPPAN